MTSRLERLEALRDVLWASIHEAPADKRSPLASQYRETMAEIESLSKPDEKAGDPIDEIAARRTARGGATARLGQAKRRTV